MAPFNLVGRPAPLGPVRTEQTSQAGIQANQAVQVQELRNQALAQAEREKLFGGLAGSVGKVLRVPGVTEGIQGLFGGGAGAGAGGFGAGAAAAAGTSAPALASGAGFGAGPAAGAFTAGGAAAPVAGFAGLGTAGTAGLAAAAAVAFVFGGHALSKLSDKPAREFRFGTNDDGEFAEQHRDRIPEGTGFSQVAATFGDFTSRALTAAGVENPVGSIGGKGGEFAVWVPNREGVIKSKPETFGTYKEALTRFLQINGTRVNLDELQAPDFGAIQQQFAQGVIANVPPATGSDASAADRFNALQQLQSEVDNPFFGDGAPTQFEQGGR